MLQPSVIYLSAQWLSSRYNVVMEGIQCLPAASSMAAPPPGYLKIQAKLGLYLPINIGIFCGNNIRSLINQSIKYVNQLKSKYFPMCRHCLRYPAHQPRPLPQVSPPYRVTGESHFRPAVAASQKATLKPSTMGTMSGTAAAS